jgi:NADPH2:quinone reductase
VKAIIVNEFGGPDVLGLEEIETPEPTGTQVLVRVHAAGVNPVDTYIRSGIHAVKPKLPYTPGKDAAGVVEAVGEDVSRFKPGDRVYTAGSISGTYAEYTLCDESHLGILPDKLSFEQGAGIWTPYATAYRALFQKAGLQKGETVVIHGASGGVGVAALQWAKGAGATVIGTAGSPAGRELIVENGADAVFDHGNPEHFAQIKDLTRGGADVIIEMLANVNLERDFEMLAMFGRIVVVGSRGSIEFTPRLAMTKDAAVYGMSLFNAPQNELDEIHDAIAAAASKGSILPIVNRRFPLSEASQAHREIIENKALGKMVLVP